VIHIDVEVDEQRVQIICRLVWVFQIRPGDQSISQGNRPMIICHESSIDSGSTVTKKPGIYRSTSSICWFSSSEGRQQTSLQCLLVLLINPSCYRFDILWLWRPVAHLVAPTAIVTIFQKV